MSTREMSIQTTAIPSSPGLDQIQVFWLDYEPGSGSVTITCYGSAWTCYFGAMGGRTIREFFGGCDTDYLVNKLGISDVLKCGKREQGYLRRVIEAVKLDIRGKPCAACGGDNHEHPLRAVACPSCSGGAK